jgi:WD40 repeat protein/serine/threonine protein kinase
MQKETFDPNAYADTIHTPNVDGSAQTLPSKRDALSSNNSSKPSSSSNAEASAPRTNSPARALSNPSLTEVHGEPYLRLEELGRGGLGRVTKAQDTRLGRVVAIKELLRNKGIARERFLREAFITAKLQHPGVVPIYEAGFWPSGEPFYAMKMIAGKSFEKIIKETSTFHQRLALLPHVLAACETIAYAHHHQIIHRDLKPHNIIVGEFGETVVIDWGLAKELHQPDINQADEHEEHAPYREQAEAALTQTGEIMGTPAYMPLEQAEGKPVNQRADVYSLGAILYHLLTGQPPYIGKKSVQVLRSLLENDPTPIRERAPEAPSALRAIVEKAMSRDEEKRYPSAKELADDLKKYLSGQLVGAHQYSLSEQLKLWVQRNQKAFWVGCIATLTLILGGSVSVWKIMEARDTAEEQRSEAQKQRSLAQENEQLALTAAIKERARSLSDTRTAARLLLEKNPSEAIHKMHQLVSDFPEYQDWSALRLLASDALSRGVPITLKEHASRINAIELSSDGRFVSASGDGVTLWSPSGELLRSFPGVASGAIITAQLSPDGEKIALISEPKDVHIINANTGESQRLEGHSDLVTELAFVSNERLLTAGEDKSIRSWNLSNMMGEILTQQKSVITDLKVSSDGRWAGVALRDGSIVRVSLLDGSDDLLGKHAGGATRVSLSPDGALLASAGLDGLIQLWDIHQKKKLRELSGHAYAVETLRFSPDGAQLLSSGMDATIKSWPIQKCIKESCEAKVLDGFRGFVRSMSFSSDGRLVAVGSSDQQIRIWDLATLQLYRTLRGHTDEVRVVRFSPSQPLLFSGGADRKLLKWSLSELTEKTLYAPTTTGWLSYSPSGKQIVASGLDGALYLFDVISGERIDLKQHQTPAMVVNFSSIDEQMLSGDASGEIIWWSKNEVKKRFAAHQGPVVDVRFSPDGERAASVGLDLTLKLWELESGESKSVPLKDFAQNIDFSPDGERIAWIDYSATIHFLSTDTMKELPGFTIGERGESASLRFSPDGSRVAVSCGSPEIQIWSLSSTPRLLTTLKGHLYRINSLEFSPKGDELVSTSNDGTARLWDITSGESRALPGLGVMVFSATFSPDGTHVAYTGEEQQIHIVANTLPKGEELSRWISSRAQHMQ